MTRPVIVLLALLTSACHSVDWSAQDPLHGTRWRNRQTFVRGDDIVLAGDPDSAANLLDTVDALRAVTRASLTRDLEPIVWIAMGPDEAALADDADGIAALIGDETLARPNRARRPPPRVSSPGRPARAPTPEEEARMDALVARSLTLSIDPATAALDLPAGIRDRTRHVVVCPTDAGLEAIAESMIDMAMATRELSLWESSVFALARGTAVEGIAEKFVEQRQRALFAWIRETQALELEDREDRLQDLARALGVAEAERPVARPLGLDEWLAATTTVVPEDAGLPAIEWEEFADDVALGKVVDTRVRVEGHGFFDSMAGRAPGRVVLMRKEGLGRADLDALFDRIGDRAGRILFSAPTRGLAAAVATLHAVERRRLPADAARSLWSTYGMPPVDRIEFASLRRFLTR